ncbi:MAG: hypothetical protein IPN82_02295 [Chitinophagaceae bacterium]|nr:hypothetical protein [Chitinophagaceae bacterium]
MKFKLLFVSALTLFFLNCNNSKKEEKKEGEIEVINVDELIDQGKNKKVTDRDFSVTPENAYNDLMLDSLAMERYIESRQLADKKISLRIRSFYNARNYHFAWFSSKGLTEQARFFWNQYDYAVTHLKDTTLVNSEFYKQAEKYLNQEKMTANSKDSLIRNTEFGFTEHFIRFINSTYEKGYVKRKEQEKFVPIKKIGPIAMADSLLNKKHSDDKYYEQVNDMYAGLKNNLQLYLDITKAGGWPTIPAIKKSLKIGDSLDVITSVKNRLQMTKDMPGVDSSSLFSDTLELAVKKFQRRHGYKETGEISNTLIKDMNVTASKRLMEILVNMDRMRWMPQKPKGNLIIVNLPEFMLHIYDGKELVLIWSL